jgi:hypothetical protein
VTDRPSSLFQNLAAASHTHRWLHAAVRQNASKKDGRAPRAFHLRAGLYVPKDSKALIVAALGRITVQTAMLFALL